MVFGLGLIWGSRALSQDATVAWRSVPSGKGGGL